MRRTRLIILLPLALALALVTAKAQSSSYSLPWFTLGNGGGSSSGGNFELNGTIGQPSAGIMNGGAFTINGGFWVSEAPEPLPYLSIRLEGASTLILSWPNPSAGYILQQTADMNVGGGGWVDVTQETVPNGSNKEVTLVATGRFCMFRLHKP